MSIEGEAGRPSRRQLEALRHIAVEERGYPPTVKELLELLQILSTNQVAELLHALERKGLIRRQPRLARAGREALR